MVPSSLFMYLFSMGQEKSRKKHTFMCIGKCTLLMKVFSDLPILLVQEVLCGILYPQSLNEGVSFSKYWTWYGSMGHDNHQELRNCLSYEVMAYTSQRGCIHDTQNAWFCLLLRGRVQAGAWAKTWGQHSLAYVADPH